MAYPLLLLSTFIIIGQVYGQDYCNVCTNHTLCLFNSTSSRCNKELSRGVSNADITTILTEHNKYRQKVAQGQETRGSPGPQPSASNMRVLVWDSEIASIAQMWVRQCLFEHDTCRNTNGTYVGQNLYLSTTTGPAAAPDWTTAIEAWYEEVPQQNRSEINPYKFKSDTGHYTALVWATTTKVGCGAIVYQKDDFNHTFYCCNYSPGGNVIGTSMYNVGVACSSCLGTCSTQYVGLCN